MRKIILKQAQSPGDILVFTRALGDLKESFPDWQIDVRTPCPEIFENSPRLTHLEETDPEVETFLIEYPEIHNSGWSGIHFTEAFIRDMETKLGVSIKRTGMRPEIWISDVEKTWINQVETDFGWKGPFWIINAGRKQDNDHKFYHRWPEVVELFNHRFKDKVKLVQVGHKDHIHPKLEGVLDLIGKTDLRQLIRLAYHAHGSVGPISFQHHLSAAFEQSAVVVAGALEGTRWEMYPHERYLSTNGCFPKKTNDYNHAWDGCWFKCPIKNGVVECMELIEPYMVADAIQMYYKGGMLTY